MGSFKLKNLIFRVKEKLHVHKYGHVFTSVWDARIYEKCECGEEIYWQWPEWTKHKLNENT